MHHLWNEAVSQWERCDYDVHPWKWKYVYGMKGVVSIMWRWETALPKVGCRVPQEKQPWPVTSAICPLSAQRPMTASERYWWSSIHSASGPHLLIMEGCNFISDWQCKTCCHILCDDVKSAMKLYPENTPEPAQYIEIAIYQMQPVIFPLPWPIL